MSTFRLAISQKNRRMDGLDRLDRSADDASAAIEGFTGEEAVDMHWSELGSSHSAIALFVEAVGDLGQGLSGVAELECQPDGAGFGFDDFEHALARVGLCSDRAVAVDPDSAAVSTVLSSGFAPAALEPGGDEGAFVFGKRGDDGLHELAGEAFTEVLGDADHLGFSAQFSLESEIEFGFPGEPVDAIEKYGSDRSPVDRPSQFGQCRPVCLRSGFDVQEPMVDGEPIGGGISGDVLALNLEPVAFFLPVGTDAEVGVDGGGQGLVDGFLSA